MLDELKDRPLVRDSKRDSGGRSVRGSNSPLNTRANSSRSLAKRSHSSWAIGQDVDHQTVTNNVLAKVPGVTPRSSPMCSTDRVCCSAARQDCGLAFVCAQHKLGYAQQPGVR